MKYAIPEVWILELDTIVLDLNGTLTCKWVLELGVKEKLQNLVKLGFTIYLLSWDQRGTGEWFAKNLGIQFHTASSSQEKWDFVASLDVKWIVAIGNARIDIWMFENAQLSIATLQWEWIHTEIIQHCDIIIPSIIDAFDLLIDIDIMKATMRK